MPCTNGCIINSQVGSDHAYCECECHIGTLPAIPPSRKRRMVVTGQSFIDAMISERDLLREEVRELRELNAEFLDALKEIEKCEAPFKVDKLEFANAVIAKSVKIAQSAIAKTKGAL